MAIVSNHPSSILRSSSPANPITSVLMCSSLDTKNLEVTVIPMETYKTPYRLILNVRGKSKLHLR